MESINCPICESTQNKHYKSFKEKNNIDQFNLVKCDCNFIFLNPRPDSNEIKKYYDSEYLPHTKSKSFFNSLYNFTQRLTFYWKLKIIKKNIPEYTNVLDIGGGSGKFSSYLNNCNIKTINYEPNLSKVSISLDNLIKNNIKFDLIMFWHSIEHIHDINTILSISNDLLNPDGRILIAAPNHNAYERKFFKEKWVAYDLPRHLYHFNYNSLKKLINKHNFDIVKYMTMYQDTLFNILLSLKSYNIIKLFYISIISLFNIVLNKKKGSSLLYICKKR